MPRGGRNVPGLQQRWALKGKLLVKMYKGKLVVQSWPKPYGKARSEAQANTQKAFQRFQRAVKFFPPQQIITAMELTKGTGMYPRDLMMAASLGTNVMLGYDEPGALPVIGDGLEKFTAIGGETTHDFDNIPPGYSNLWLTYLARTTQAQPNSDMFLTFNGDGTASYDWTLLFNTGNVNSRGQTAGFVATLCGATALAGAAGGGSAIIPGYSNTHFWKQCVTENSRLDQSIAGEPVLLSTAINWRRTDAISRITMHVTGGFVAGSQISLYGLF